ncbi:MAG: hypothetical protein WC516_03840 [Patescibacteria group bacterium]
MEDGGYSTEVGALIVIWRRSDPDKKLIVKVVQINPLIVKATERGPLAAISQATEGFKVLDDDSAQFQRDLENHTGAFLHGQKLIRQPVFSGLRCLGIMSNRLVSLEPPREQSSFSMEV